MRKSNAHYHMPTRIGYRIGMCTDRCYRHLTIQIRQGLWRNAAREYELDGSASTLGLLQELREKTGQTYYLDVGSSSYEAEFELRWQSHKLGSDDYAVRDNPDLLGKWQPEWYACKLEGATFSIDTIDLMKRVAQRVVQINGGHSLYDASPAQVVEAIKALKGLAVNYGGEKRVETPLGCWYPDGEGRVEQLDPNCDQNSPAPCFAC
jgi:hypothetical protein